MRVPGAYDVGLALIMFLKHVISFWHALKDPLIVTPSRKLAMFSLASHVLLIWSQTA